MKTTIHRKTKHEAASLDLMEWKPKGVAYWTRKKAEKRLYFIFMIILAVCFILCGLVLTLVSNILYITATILLMSGVFGWLNCWPLSNREIRYELKWVVSYLERCNDKTPVKHLHDVISSMDVAPDDLMDLFVRLLRAQSQPIQERLLSATSHTNERNKHEPDF